MTPHILVIDDDSDTRLLINHYLQTQSNNNIKIFNASDPVEGLNVYHKNRDKITHIICDHYMPIENGLELCKMIKEKNSEIKIIMYSADPNLRTNEKMFYVDAFLVKPYDMNKIYQIL